MQKFSDFSKTSGKSANRGIGFAPESAEFGRFHAPWGGNVRNMMAPRAGGVRGGKFRLHEKVPRREGGGTEIDRK